MLYYNLDIFRQKQADRGPGRGGGGGGQSKIRAANENKLIKTQNKRMKLTKMTK